MLRQLTGSPAACMLLNEMAKIKAMPILNEVEKAQKRKDGEESARTQCDTLILLDHGKDTKYL